MTPDCLKVQEAMSAYFDGELGPSEREFVDTHLPVCAVCTHLLDEFRSLSTLTQSLREPIAHPSTKSFEALANRITVKSAGKLFRRPVFIAGVFAATLLMALAIAWKAGVLSTHHVHDHETAAVRAYLRLFTVDPERAQQELVAAYLGKKVSFDEALTQFKHPLVSSKAPPGYRIESTNMFDFPCCRCIQTVFMADDARPVVVLEHVTERSEWFADRSIIDIACDGVPCRIVQLDGMLASTWRVSSHQITLIGITDVAELSTWIRFLNGQQAAVRVGWVDSTTTISAF